jgi:hypothetical protein
MPSVLRRSNICLVMMGQSSRHIPCAVAFNLARRKTCQDRLQQPKIADGTRSVPATLKPLVRKLIREVKTAPLRVHRRW